MLADDSAVCRSAAKSALERHEGTTRSLLMTIRGYYGLLRYYQALLGLTRVPRLLWVGSLGTNAFGLTWASWYRLCGGSYV